MKTRYRTLPQIAVLSLLLSACAPNRETPVPASAAPVESPPLPLVLGQADTGERPPLEAEALRTGAVRLRWRSESAAAAETAIFRREAGSGADWERLASVRWDEWTDRATRRETAYEYQIRTEGLRVHGGGRRESATARVGQVVPPGAPLGFAAVTQDAGTVSVEWTLPRDSRSGGFRLHGRVDEEWTVLAELPPDSEGHEVRVEAADVAQWRLEVLDPESGQAIHTAVCGTSGLLAIPGDWLDAPAPRLFVDSADFAGIAASEDPAIQNARDAAVGEARDALSAITPLLGKLPRARGRGHQGNMADIRRLALGWRLTGDGAMRDAAVAALLEYAEFYAAIPIVRRHADGHLTGQTLNEAMLLINTAWAYDLLGDSLEPADREKIRSGLLQPGADLLLSHNRRKSNWQTWHNAALVALGTVLNDPDMIRTAIDGPSGIRWQMRHTFGRDGIYNGQSIAYHYFTMHAFTLSAQMLGRRGVDLFGYTDGSRSLPNYYDATFWHAFSNGRQAPFGNSQVNYGVTAQWIAFNYALAAAAYGDPVYRWQWEVSEGARRRKDERMPPLLSLWALAHAEELPGPAPKRLGSSVINEAVRHVAGNTLLGEVGMGVLRGQPGRPGAETAVIWKPEGKTAGHQRANALAFHWQSPSHDWVPSSGKWEGYTTAAHRDWVMQTLTDNTLLVHRRSHRPLTPGAPNWVTDEPGVSTAGDLEVFTAGPGFGYLRAGTRRAYADAALTRRMVNTGVYTLDIAGAAVDGPATVDYVLHVHGELDASNLEFEADGEPLAKDHGFGFLDALRVARGDGAWESAWRHADTEETFFLTMAGFADTAYRVATTPWAGGRTRSTLLATRQGKDTGFLSVLRAGNEDPVLSIEGMGDQAPDALAGAVRIRLRTGERDEVFWAPDITLRQTGMVEFSARDGIVRFGADGFPSDILLVEGASLRVGAHTLQFSHPVHASWTRLDGGGFLLLSDEAFPVTVRMEGETELAAVRLDEWGVRSMPLARLDGGGAAWQVPPHTAVVFFPAGTEPPAPPPLTQTIQGQP